MSFSYQSLALFRVGLGALCLIQALTAWSHFEAFYSEQGILPLSEARVLSKNWSVFSGMLMMHLREECSQCWCCRVLA